MRRERRGIVQYTKENGRRKEMKRRGRGLNLFYFREVGGGYKRARRGKRWTRTGRARTKRMEEAESGGFMQNKKKRKRTAPDQLKVLEDIFNTHQHPNLTLRNQLACQLGMTPRSVQIWFQNRRAKARNMEFTTPSPSSALPISTQPSLPSSSPPSPPLDASSSSIEESVYKSFYLATVNPKAEDEDSEEVHSFWLQFLQSQQGESESLDSSQDSPLSDVTSKDPAPTAPLALPEQEEKVPSPPSTSPPLSTAPSPTHKFDVNTRDSTGLSLLFVAVVLGYEHQVKRLIDAGADVNIIDNKGNSPLAAASVMGHTNIGRLLLGRGSDCNLGNGEGQTPLYLACMQQPPLDQFVRLLLHAGAEVDVRSEESVSSLHIASLKGNSEICRILLNHGATVNVYDKNKYTPLHHACVKGHLNIVVQLLSCKNIDINAKDSKGHTPLHAAALMGFEQVVNILIENKADLDAQDVDGYTPLHYAVREGREGVVKCLIRAGADLDKKSNSKLGILHIAARWSSVQMGKLLIDSGCKAIDDKSANGLRPLHFAALTGKVNFMKLLVERGANPIVNDLLLSGEPVLLSDCDFHALPPAPGNDLALPPSATRPTPLDSPPPANQPTPT